MHINVDNFFVTHRFIHILSLIKCEYVHKVHKFLLKIIEFIRFQQAGKASFAQFISKTGFTPNMGHNEAICIFFAVFSTRGFGVMMKGVFLIDGIAFLAKRWSFVHKK